MATSLASFGEGDDFCVFAFELDAAATLRVRAIPKVKGPWRSLSGLNCTSLLFRSLSAQLSGLVMSIGVACTPATGLVSIGLAPR